MEKEKVVEVEVGTIWSAFTIATLLKPLAKKGGGASEDNPDNLCLNFKDGTQLSYCEGMLHLRGTQMEALTEILKKLCIDPQEAKWNCDYASPAVREKSGENHAEKTFSQKSEEIARKKTTTKKPRTPPDPEVLAAARALISFMLFEKCGESYKPRVNLSLSRLRDADGKKYPLEEIERSALIAFGFLGSYWVLTKVNPTEEEYKMYRLARYIQKAYRAKGQGFQSFLSGLLPLDCSADPLSLSKLVGKTK